MLTTHLSFIERAHKSKNRVLNKKIRVGNHTEPVSKSYDFSHPHQTATDQATMLVSFLLIQKLSLVQNLCQPLLQGCHALFVLRNNWDCTNEVSSAQHTAKIQQKVLWPNLFLYLSPLIAITVHSYIFGIENLLFLLI